MQQYADIRGMQSALIMEQDRNARLIGNNQDILNKLVADKLAPVAPVVNANQMQQTENIPLRKPQWNKIRADYEAKKRQEFWQSRIAEVEAADKKKES